MNNPSSDSNAKWARDTKCQECSDTTAGTVTWYRCLPWGTVCAQWRDMLGTGSKMNFHRTFASYHGQKLEST